MTLDLDFADVRAYPPESYPGIMVFRVPRQHTSLLTSILRRVTPLLNQEPVKRHLWIVEENRVRIRGGEDESEWSRLRIKMPLVVKSAMRLSRSFCIGQWDDHR